MTPTPPEEFLTAERAKTLRRLLYVVLGFAAVLLLLGLPLVIGDYVRFGTFMLAIGAVFGVLGWLTLTAVRRRAPSARRLCLVTGVVIIVLSVLLVQVLIGLLTVVLGIGLLVVTVAPERDSG